MQDKFAFKVGVVSIIMIVVIAGLLVWKSGIFLKATGYHIIGRFENISGLLKGSEVRYRGYKVGKVFEINPEESQILVHMWIKDGIHIPQGAVARVVFDGLVGEKFLSLRPGPDSGAALLKSGDKIEGYASAGLADAIEVTVKNLEHTEAILRSFRTILTDPKISNSFAKGILSLESTLTNVSAITGQLNNQNMMGNLGKTAKNLDSLTTSLQRIVDKVDQKVLNNQNTDEIKEIIRNIREFSDQLKQNPESSKSGSGAASLLSTAMKLRIKPSLNLGYHADTKQLSYNGNIDTKVGNTFLRTGFGDGYQQGQLTAVQLGHTYGAISGRVGAFYGKAGAGIDLQPTPETDVSLDIFEPNNLKFEVSGKLKVLPNVESFIKYRSRSLEYSNNSGEIGAGITLRP